MANTPGRRYLIPRIAGRSEASYINLLVSFFKK